MAWPNKSATALRENTPPGYFPVRLMENQPAGLVFPSPAVRTFSPFKLPQSGQRKRKDRPFGRSFFFCLFRLKPGPDTGFQKGISPSADGDLRLCLKTPQAFRERLERKLQLGVRRLLFLFRPEILRFLSGRLFKQLREIHRVRDADRFGDLVCLHGRRAQ